MRTRDRSGFNLIELAVVAVVVWLAATVLFSAYNEGITRSVASSLAVRARDIYVALAAADAEREPLGAPSLWTSALDPATRSRLRDRPIPEAFSNSTAFFNCLIENRLCEGLRYDSLGGGGVPTGRSGAFGATNNVWSVAVNLRDDLPDAVSLLITRNVDLSSLASRMGPAELAQAARVDPVWREPFGDSYLVCVKKGGAIYKGRLKAMPYRTLCGAEPFDPRVDKTGQPEARPLTYLTPSRAIVSGGVRP